MQQFQMILFKILLFLLLSYCLLNGAYTAIIGGSPFYFFSSLLLIFQILLSAKYAAFYKQITIFSAMLLCGLLYYQYNLDMLNTSNFQVFASFLCIHFIYSQQIPPKNLILLKIILIMCLILLTITQYNELIALKAYFSSLNNGESWQEFGAL